MSLSFAYGVNVFSHYEVHMMLNLTLKGLPQHFFFFKYSVKTLESTKLISNPISFLY